jgi:hypothetical protein
MFIVLAYMCFSLIFSNFANYSGYINRLLLDYLYEKRNLDMGESTVRVGIDGGQGSLKIIMNVFDEESLDDGGGDKLTGVKKVIVLAYVSGIEESSHNLRILYNATRLNEIKCFFACDFKVLNMIVGIRSHEWVHPCLYCNGKMKEAGGFS